MQNTLGISLGSRLLGTAIIYDGELVDFRVRTFSGVWTDAKRQTVLVSIERTIKQYGITKIVVKTPKEYHSSKSITELKNELITLGEKLNIRIIICTINTILRRNKEVLKNKQSLIESILNRYRYNSQLAQMYEKEQQNHAPYYVKLFEAIACTEL